VITHLQSPKHGINSHSGLTQKYIAVQAAMVNMAITIYTKTEVIQRIISNTTPQEELFIVVVNFE